MKSFKVNHENESCKIFSANNNSIFILHKIYIVLYEREIQREIKARGRVKKIKLIILY